MDVLMPPAKHRTFSWYLVKFCTVLALLALLGVISTVVTKTNDSFSTSSSAAAVHRSTTTMRKVLGLHDKNDTNVCVPGGGEDVPEAECIISAFASNEALCQATLTPDHPCNNKYLQLQFCTFAGVQWLYYILMGLWLFVLFYLLGDTAQEYFCPSLTKMSEYFRLSPNVAGVTLLALGNGAPDISAIAVSILTGGSAEFGIGGPVGGGMFVTTVVMGFVTIFADVRVTRRPFIRDVAFYLVSIAFSLYLYISGIIYFWQGIMLLILYVIYVCVVVIGRIVYQSRKRRRNRNLTQQIKEKRIKKKSPELGASLLDDAGGEAATGSEPVSRDASFGQVVEEEGSSSSESEDEAETGGGWRVNSMPVFPTEDLGGRRVTFSEATLKATAQIEAQQQQQQQQPTPSVAPAVLSINEADTDDEGTSGSVGSVDSFRNRRQGTEFDLRNAYLPKFGMIRASRSGAIVVKEYFPDSGESKDDTAMEEIIEEKNPAKRLLLRFLNSIEWEEKNWRQRILFIVLYAFWTFIRNLTIPKAEGWSKNFMMFTPIFAPLFVLFAAGPSVFITLLGGVFPLALVIAAIGSLFTLAIFFTARKTKPPKYFPVFVFACFAMSIAWIYVIANELLDVLSAIGAAWNIPNSVLAITVLAWGNSVGDMISNIVVARQGFPSMAIGACFGGPLFNALVGFGMAFTFAPSALKDGCTPLNKSPTVMLSFLFLLVSLLMSIIVVPVCKFRSRKPYGGVLIGLYVVYLVLAIIAAKVDDFGKLFIF